MKRRDFAIIKARSWLKGDDCLFLDTETTGMQYFDQVVEIAIIDSLGDPVINTLCRPTCDMSDAAQRVHGISKDELHAAPAFEEIFSWLNRVLTMPAKIVAYNAPFDARMLSQTAEAHDLHLKTAHIECAMGLYEEFMEREQWTKLQTAINECRIAVSQNHRAMGDAEMCRRLVRYIAQSPLSTER